MTNANQNEAVGGNFLIQRWREAGLFARIMVATVLLTIVSVGVLSLVLRNRTLRSTQLILDQFGTLSRNQAEEQLLNIVAGESQDFNNFFETVTEDLLVASEYLTVIDAEKEIWGQGTYWNANDELVQLAEGQWANSADDPASFLAPSTFDLTDETAVIVNTAVMNDFVLPQILESNDNMLAIYYVDQTGATFYYPNIELASLVGDFDPRERPYYQTFVTSSTEQPLVFWSEPYTDAALNGLVSTNSVPVYSADGAFTGVIAADLLIKTITDRVSSLQVGDTGYAFLIDEDGHYISVPENAYADLGLTGVDFAEDGSTEKTAFDAPASLQPVMSEMTEANSGLQIISLDDTDYYVAFSPINSVNYSLGVVVPVGDIQQSFFATITQLTEFERENGQFILIAVIVILLFAAGIGYLMSLFLTRPINHLTNVAEQVAAGDLTVRADENAGGEMGVLARAFNETTSQLQDSIVGLEKRVAERTQALRTSTEVSRRLSTLLDQTELTAQVVNQVQKAFNFYHVHIYLRDEQTGDMLMAGGTGEAGRIMLAQGHQIALGKGLVGRCASQNETIQVNDVTQNPEWLPNELLPETKSEVAVPIALDDQVIGVLDVQQNRVNGLSEEDVYFLETIANQVAVALRNAKAYSIAQVQAKREAVINDINRRIQMATNIETVLQVAAREVGKALDAKQVDIRIGKTVNGNGRNTQ